MKPGPLKYVRPNSIAEAIERLAKGGMDSKILAGGQSLVPMLNLRMIAADQLIDIMGISALSQFSDEGNEVYLGACVTHEQIQVVAVPDPSNGLMPTVANRLAYQAVRNRGTIGGSLALADPAAEWLATTAVLGATIEWQGLDGPRSCLAEDFVVGAYMTRLDVSDVLTGIRIPRLSAEAKWGTYKLCRKVGEFAHTLATVIRHPKSSRAFLGAAEGAPIRLRHTESVLSQSRDWQVSHGKVISAAFASDLIESDRELTDVHAWQSQTCLLRATQMSFGVDMGGIEVA